MSLGAFIEEIGLRHFAAVEITSACHDGYPPPALWANIVPTLIVLDAAREELERPIEIVSAWRSVGHNAAVGGKRLSQHLVFTALDVVVVAQTWRVHAQRRLQQLLDEYRGRRFAAPFAFWRTAPEAAGMPEIPFAALETWDERHGARSEFVFRGGLGRYQDFTHVDTRGVDADWGD